MDLKSVQSSALVAFRVEAKTLTEKETGSVPEKTASTRISEGVVKDVQTTKPSVSSSYSSVNSLINLGHIAADGIDEATGLVQSLVDQVNKGNFDQVYKELPKVGATLADIADRKTPEGIAPLSGNEFIIEEQPPRTLRFPGDVKNAFGLTKTPPPDEYDLAFLQEKLDAFKDESKSILKNIYEEATAADIAAQNILASGASTNDVDQVVALASNTSKAITVSPKEALNASGADLTNSARLLQ
jgi:hypothetical protein